jgi:hypothetical protein
MSSDTNVCDGGLERSPLGSVDLMANGGREARG